jgi:hypothetical protein
MLDGHHLVEVHLHAARLPTLKPAWRQWARDFGGTGATNRVYDPDGTVGPGREAHAKRVPCRSARGFGQNGWHERGVFHCAPPAPPWSVQQVLSRVCRAVFSADCSRRLHRPEDIAIDYKQLFEVERGWRDLKSVIDLRPVYHRSKTASAPTSCCAGWPYSSHAPPRSPPGTPGRPSAPNSTGSTPSPSPAPTGTFRQTTELTKTQRDLLTPSSSTHPRRSSSSRQASDQHKPDSLEHLRCRDSRIGTECYGW